MKINLKVALTKILVVQMIKLYLLIFLSLIKTKILRHRIVFHLALMIFKSRKKLNQKAFMELQKVEKVQLHFFRIVLLKLQKVKSFYPKITIL